jgi:aldose 1-epimerase
MTETEKDKIQKFTLRNANGMTVDITNFGATITAINAPDKRGKFENVVLGLKDIEEYKTDNPHHLGGTIGRVCNRIIEGKFSLDGKEYNLTKNNGGNHLHGGDIGFDKVAWSVESSTNNSITLTHTSPDGDEGYPGELKVKVKYTLNDNNEVSIKYEAHSNKQTPVNLTNHSYFNLNGNGKETVENHSVQVNSSQYTPVDGNYAPMKIESVDGTPFDLRKATFLEKILHNNPNKQLSIVGGGLDHNFVLDVPNDKKLRIAAQVIEPESGRILEVRTTEPAVQLYTGNHLGPRHSGVCFETQHFPDSVNHPEFPSTILKPGETYSSETTFKFSVAKEVSASR